MVQIAGTLNVAQNTRERESSSQLAGASIITATIQTMGEVINGLMRASMTNPLMSCIAGLVIGDMLQKANLITETTNLEIRLLILTAAGINITQELINVITQVEGAALVPFTSSVKDQILVPSAQTVVFGDTTSSIQLNALLSQLAKAKG